LNAPPVTRITFFVRVWISLDGSKFLTPLISCSGILMFSVIALTHFFAVLKSKLSC
jgi:hypothetical protein